MTTRVDGAPTGPGSGAIDVTFFLFQTGLVQTDRSNIVFQYLVHIFSITNMSIMLVHDTSVNSAVSTFFANMQATVFGTVSMAETVAATRSDMIVRYRPSKAGR